MSEYEHTQRIEATPDQVFAFVSDVGNLPKYLPTTHSAQSQGSERVRVQGEAQGHRYDADGYFRRDEANGRLEWGSDGEISYSGWLEVKPGPDGDDRSSSVTVHLSFGPNPREAVNAGGPPPDGAPSDRDIQDSLEKALVSIQNQVEGKGGKVEPAAAT